MLEVKIEKILPVTEARDSFNKLIDEVEGTDELYVLTKNGKPAAVIVGVHHLEKLTGTSEEELMEKADEADTTSGSSATNDSSSVSADDATINNTANNTVTDVAKATPSEPVAEESPITTVAEETNSSEMPVMPTTEEEEAAPITPTVEPVTQTSSITSNPLENGATATPAPEATNDDPLDFLNDDTEVGTASTETTPIAEQAATPTQQPAPMPQAEPAPTSNGYAPVVAPIAENFGAPAQPADNGTQVPPTTIQQ